MVKKSLLTISMVTLLGFVAIGGLNLNYNVFATTQEAQNGFGDAASGCAKDKSCPTDDGGKGSMGEHSKAGSDFAGNPPFDDNDDKNGRTGIGNIAKNCDSVSDLGNALSGKSNNCNL